jgi:hypothetical protein
MIKAVIIISAWSSGSTAVAGYLDKCGAYTCPPHLNTIDERTPNSYEPLIYRRELGKLFDDFSFEEIGNPADFINFFEAWWDEECAKAKKLGCSHIILKHPLQTFVLPYLKKKLNPSFVFITRPYDEIEETRKRRNWHPSLGAEGAQVIQSVAYNFFTANSCPFISIPFNIFRNDSELRKKMLDFIKLSPSIDQIQNAEAFLRPE